MQVILCCLLIPGRPPNSFGLSACLLQHHMNANVAKTEVVTFCGASGRARAAAHTCRYAGAEVPVSTQFC
jgi:hypothetical protein